MQQINGFSEKLLIKRLRDGDVTAFEMLFRHYYPGLVIYVTTFTIDRFQAEEIVQDFFTRLWEKHHDINACDSLKSYCFQSIKNRSLNLLKKQKVKQEYIDQLKQEAKQNLVFNPDIYISTELQNQIEHAVNGLPEKCREVFIMNRFQGLKNEEIAASLNISKRTVETHISKALKILREELKDYVSLLVLLNIL